MAMPSLRQKRDPALDEVLRFVADYEANHPGSRGTAYRWTDFCIRIRLIDPRFQGWSLLDRDEFVRPKLDLLSEPTQSEVTFLLLLTEEELGDSDANMDFEDPTPVPD